MTPSELFVHTSPLLKALLEKQAKLAQRLKPGAQHFLLQHISGYGCDKQHDVIQNVQVKCFCVKEGYFKNPTLLCLWVITKIHRNVAV